MTTLVTFDCGAGIELVSPLSVSDIIVEHLAVCRSCPTDREQALLERIEEVRTTERTDAAVADAMHASKANREVADCRMLGLQISGDALAIRKAHRPRKDAA